ncbi:SDR family NAD(P)-dependent oxidoreductase [Opitutaceae bacterium]|nr:SDR family NAD(P)-dependent oxidoreductase [Opitutaceae bacterium]
MNESPLRQGTIFVSGASSGLGRAIAELWLRNGYAVWGTARQRERLTGLAENPDFHPVEMDLRDRDRMLDAFSTAERDAGGFSVVVNNAGFGVYGELGEVSEEVWSDQITSMLTNLMMLVRNQVSALRARGAPATLVNVSSLAVEFPLPYMSGYNVAKSGLSALSESLMLELKATEIRVIDFRPGDFRTQFNAAMAPILDPVTSPQVGDNDLKIAWDVLQKNLAEGPQPEVAAQDLWTAVARGRQGIIRTGDWFQARLAPILNRLVPQGLARIVRWRYFGIR